MNNPEARSHVPERRPRRSPMLAALLLGGLVASACQMGPGMDDGVDSLQFQDVVVPAGFRLQDKTHESYSREVGSWRDATFIYEGNGQIEEAASYVLTRMPQHSWEKVDEQALDAGQRQIRFERGIYSADYKFTRQDGTTQMVVEYATHYDKR